MSENVTVVRRVLEEVINEGNLDAATELVAPDAKVHVPFEDPGTGPEALRRIASSLRTGFPDIHIEIEDVIEAGDKVVVRWRTTRQTHTGPYRGLPPTGKQVRVTAIQIFRLEQGRVAEFWLEMDQLDAVRQMGVVAPEGMQGPRLALFVLGSLGRMAFLEARHGLSRKQR